MSGLQIRALCAGDAPQAAVLAGNAQDAWSAQSILETLSGARACCLAAQLDGVLAGFCLCDTVLDEASLYAINVAPACRRRGVGRALLEQLCAQLAARGAARLYLEVRSQNAPALALYGQCGFVRTGLRRHFYTAPCDDAVLMQKELQPWSAS